MRSSNCLALLVLLSSAAAAADDAPAGPAFGSNTFLAAIDPVGNEPDVDDYAASLAKGERLFVEIDAARGSALAPTLRLVGPDGADVETPTRTRRGGRSIGVAGFVVPTTGRWTVEVGAAGGTAGAYTARLRVARGARPPAATRRIDAAAPVAEFAFEAVDGSRLDVSIRSKDGDALAVPAKILGPDGVAWTLGAPAVRVRGDVVTASAALAHGDGAYRLLVVADGGASATCTATLRTAPPQRPRGRTSLAAEPYLVHRTTPLEGGSGAAVRLFGAHFPRSRPYADVRFGGLRAAVLAVGPYGDFLDVAPPTLDDGALVDVVVANPDGQSVARRGYFRFVRPPQLDVTSIEPREVVLQQGAVQKFTVTLARPAPALGIALPIDVAGDAGAAPPLLSVPGGATRAAFDFHAAGTPGAGRVAVTLLATAAAEVRIASPAGIAAVQPATAKLLENAKRTFTVVLDGPAPPAGLYFSVSVSGGIGAAPGFVFVPGNASSADFEFTAGPVRAIGKLTVSSANAVEAAVTVAPATTIDVSGWTIVQQNSSRTFTVPAGTTLTEGGYLVVGRNATRAAFETFWGRELAPSVVYVDGADQWPNVNGSETYELRDAGGVTVDGPTIAMAAAGGQTCRRVPGGAASLASSWIVAAATPVGNADPGTGQTQPPAPAGVYVSEFADAVGTGNFAYEFVELHFDRLP